MRRFNYKSLADISRDAEANAPHVRFEADRDKVRSILARPVKIGDRQIGNSLAIHPMEGCDGDPDGRPGALTWRRYQRFASGGAKLIWFEATAIQQDGRANPRQLWLNANTQDDYARLIETIRRDHAAACGTADDLLVPMQLTHSGRYSYPNRIIAYHNPHIDRKTGTPASQEPISDSELERLEDVYVEAAGRALDCGFNAIDVKIVHGYLLSELSGAKVRPGLYGGPLENRLRLPINVMRKIRDRYGRRLLIAARLGCFDGVPYFTDEKTNLGVPADFARPYEHGFGVNPDNPLEPDVAEVRRAVGLLRDAGLELLNVSLACPYYNPHIGRPFEKPDDGNYESPEHPMLGVDRHFRIAGELQRAFPDLPMVGTGYSWLQKYSINAAAHNVAEGAIRIAGMGRSALAYPDFARDALEKGELEELRVCKTLTYCTWLMRQKNHPLGQVPAGCPPFDKEGYGEIMKESRKAQRVALTTLQP
jgi:NADPH2 dehydrogenase